MKNMNKIVIPFEVWESMMFGAVVLEAASLMRDAHPNLRVASRKLNWAAEAMVHDREPDFLPTWTDHPPGHGGDAA